MENIQTIRSRIGDKYKTEVENYIGNGVLTGFDIHGKNPYDFEIEVNGTPLAESAFEYDADIKKVLLDTAPAADATIKVTYKDNAFTDAELTAIYTASGEDLDKATAESLRQALGDQARMVSFQHGDRSVSMSDIFKNLMSLLNSYEKRISNSGANSGSSFAIGKRTMDETPFNKSSRPDDLSRLLGYE